MYARWDAPADDAPRKPSVSGWMPQRPPVLNFDGLTEMEAYEKAKTEFDRLYRTTTIVEALGKKVVFPQGACHHICYKADDCNTQQKIWRPDRAAHIPWISTILTSPWEIRPNKVRGRWTYLLQFSADPASGIPRGAMYFAVVESANVESVWFVTAYPLLTRKYWNEARLVGPCLYPPNKVARNETRK